jgi:uncharacterized membrane protein
MEQRSEVGQALNKLQAVRQQNSRLALMAKPVAVRKGGFLGWLQNASPTSSWCHLVARSLLPLECAALTDFGTAAQPSGSKLLATGGGGLRLFYCT